MQPLRLHPHREVRLGSARPLLPLGTAAQPPGQELAAGARSRAREISPQAHGGKLGDTSIFGQEFNPTTWKLAKMNLANPPFNDSDWGGDRLREDVRWKFGVPPSRARPRPGGESGVEPRASGASVLPSCKGAAPCPCPCIRRPSRSSSAR
ncbi:MAG TPA: N-6 DNA methylase [Myxococcaceae bacterium]|nr:N-6 DNA methylase [Myxococcaceae bacterium]